MANNNFFLGSLHYKSKQKTVTHMLIKIFEKENQCLDPELIIGQK